MFVVWVEWFCPQVALRLPGVGHGALPRGADVVTIVSDMVMRVWPAVGYREALCSAKKTAFPLRVNPRRCEGVLILNF